MEIGWLYGYLTQVDLLPGEVIVGVRGKYINNDFNLWNFQFLLAKVKHFVRD